MKTQTLSRVIGSHASLIGMASYLVLSGPSAAFAATDSKDVTLNLNVTSNITLSQVTVPGALTIGAGGAASTGDATYTVNTNTYNGYNVTIDGAACGSVTPGIICSGATGLADTTAAWDPAASSGNGNGTISPGYGVAFHVLTTSAGYNGTWFGADDGASAKFAGVPSSAKQIVNKGTPGASDGFNVRFRVQAPVGQNSGAYTNVVPITFTATTNS